MSLNLMNYMTILIRVFIRVLYNPFYDEFKLVIFIKDFGIWIFFVFSNKHYGIKFFKKTLVKCMNNLS